MYRRKCGSVFVTRKYTEIRAGMVEGNKKGYIFYKFTDKVKLNLIHFPDYLIAPSTD